MENLNIHVIKIFFRKIHHPRAQRLVAHTPNQSLNILSTNSFLQPPNAIYSLINRRLRELLSRAVRK